MTKVVDNVSFTMPSATPAGDNVISGGQVIALEEAGLSDAFDIAVGVSTGAPIAAYFLAQQSVLGTSIYYEECTTPQFISLSRMRVGADYLVAVAKWCLSTPWRDVQ